MKYAIINETLAIEVSYPLLFPLYKSDVTKDSNLQLFFSSEVKIDKLELVYNGSSYWSLLSEESNKKSQIFTLDNQKKCNGNFASVETGGDPEKAQGSK